jgi:capsular polysaccharide biosynthesis protein
MGYLVAERLPATYESEATLLVGPVSGDRETLQASGTQARTYAGIAQTATILNGAARNVGMTPSSVESKLDVTASDITRLITVRARDGEAARASEIANSVANALRGYANRQALATPPEGRLTIVERAVPSTNEIGPSKDLILPLAAIAGMLGALGLAAFVDSLSTVVRSEEELSAVAPVAVLGSVDGAGGRVPAVDSAPDSGVAATYRLLAAKIELWNDRNVPRSIVVVDARGGRSSVGFAANLAGALAEGGATVTLVDNGERGDAASLFGFSEPATSGAQVRRGRPVRAGQIMLDRFRVKRSSLTILRLRNSEALETETPTEVLRELLEEADVVVVTVPPLERSPNSLVWSRAAEATILVTERDHTRREQIPADVESLRRVGANVIGTVLYTNRGF